MTEYTDSVVTRLVMDTSSYKLAEAQIASSYAKIAATTKSAAGKINMALGGITGANTRFQNKTKAAMIESGKQINNTAKYIHNLSRVTTQWTDSNSMGLNKVGAALAGYHSNVINAGSQTKSFAENAKRFGGMVNLNKVATDRWAASLEKVPGKLKPVGNQLGGIQTWLRRVASAMGVMATMMAIRGVAAIVSFAAEFEASMTKIISLVGMSKQQVGEWSDALYGIAERSRTGLLELGDALYYITSGGIRGVESLELLEQVAMASSAGLGEMGSVANTVVSAMNAWGKENLSASQATGILLATVREGKIKTEELAGTFSKVIPIASSLGVSMGQLGGALAVVSRDGMDAAKATTGLRRLLIALAAPTVEAEKALEKVGLTSAFLREALAGPNGLQEAMEYLAIATGGSFAEIEKVIPPLRALTPALSLMNKSLEESRKIFSSVDADQTAAVLKAHTVGADTAKRKIDAMSSAWSTFKIVIGESDTIMFAVDAVALGLNRISRAMKEISDSSGRLEKENIGAGLAKDFNKINDTGLSLLKLNDALIELGYSGSDLNDVMHGFKMQMNLANKDSFYLTEQVRLLVKVVEKEFAAIRETENALVSKTAAEKSAILATNLAIIADENATQASKEKAIADRDSARALLESTMQDRLKALALKKANAEIKIAIKNGASFVDLLKRHGKAVHIATAGTGDYAKIFKLLEDRLKKTQDELKKTAEEQAKLTKEQEKADEASFNVTQKFVDQAMVIGEFADTLGIAGVELSDTTDELIDEAIALYESGKWTDLLSAKIEIFLARLKEMKDGLGGNIDDLNDYQKAVEKVASAFQNIANENLSNSLFAAMTGDFGDLIDSYQTLGEDLASAIADGIASFGGGTGFDEIKKYIKEWVGELDTDTQRIIGNVASGIGAAATAYGIYQGAQEGTMSVGEGALAGAAAGIAFSGVGALVGAVVGAALAGMSQRDADQAYIGYRGDTGATSTQGSRGIDTLGLETFQADFKEIVRQMKGSFFDLAELFDDPDLFIDLAETFKDMRFSFGQTGDDLGAIIENIFTNRLPRALLNQVAPAFIGAFEDMGFGDLASAAFAQAFEMSGDAATEFIMEVAQGVFALNNAMQDLDFESLIEQLSMTQMEVFSKFMTESLADIALIQQRMASEFDAAGLANDAERIAAIIISAREAELQMLSQIKQMQDGINATFDSIDRQLRMADKSGQFNVQVFANDLQDAMEGLRGALSPEEITQFGQAGQTALQNMMSLVEEGQWDMDIQSWFEDPVIGGLNWGDEIFDTFGLDPSEFDGTIREFFQEISKLMRGETDIAFDGATERVEEWADALEQAALDTAAALNALAIEMGQWSEYVSPPPDPTPFDIDPDTGEPVDPNSSIPWWKDVETWSPIVTTMTDLGTIDNDMNASILASGETRNDLLNEYIATPPTVEINIDGTLDPLIALIDMRIQTARDSGGGP